jgi:hypothetical protein
MKTATNPIIGLRGWMARSPKDTGSKTQGVSGASGGRLLPQGERSTTSDESLLAGVDEHIRMNAIVVTAHPKKVLQ